MNDEKKACELAEQAVTNSLDNIDTTDGETFRDAKSIIELLKDNLSFWKEEEGDNAVEDLWALTLNSVHYNFTQVLIFWYPALFFYIIFTPFNIPLYMH